MPFGIFLCYYLYMVISSIKETSYDGMVKVACEEGAAFYIRKEYLPNVDFSLIDVGNEFTGSDEDEILDAGLASVVELKAITYLARAEQSRFGLTRKLVAKEYEKKYIDMALTYLESKNYLNDGRFALAWLHGRRINHYEGRTKLKAELASRGIGRDVAAKAIDEFFEEYDEMEICCKAYEKFIKKGKTDDKLVSAMMTAGFTYKQIKEAKEIFEEK